MTLPNFLIVGAPKAGTTSLFDYLGQHPEVYTPPVKEPCFFSSGLPAFTHDLAEYEALFAGQTTQTAIGEASTTYLYDPDAARRIHDLLPEARIIIMLRNPAERAYSEWAYNALQLACEPLSFEAALEAEEERAASPAFRAKYTMIHYSSFL
ncbi:MAG: sulfotransferase domain-containing protein [Kiritimatiellia bacterium]